MYKILLTILVTSVLLNASEATDACTKDMTQMMGSYYQAQKDKREDNTADAAEGYKKSIAAAYSALESCEGQKNYDFAIMYSFIQESEKEYFLLSL